MTQTQEEKINVLNKLDKLLERKFNGDYEDSEAGDLRRDINEVAPVARQIVIEANCLKLMNVSPPPAVGGPLIQNMDPFDTIFESYYGASFIPNIRDMLQQAVGVLRAGNLIVEKQADVGKERMVYKQLEVPEKVTLGWLFHNVSVKLWSVAVGILIAAVGFGIKASTWEFVREIFGLCSCA